jgi:hypothetical protein
VVGLKAQCRLEARAGQRGVALLVEDESDIGMGIGVIRRDAESLHEGGGGLIEPSQAAEGHAVVAMVGRLVGVSRDGPGDQAGGPVVVIPLVGHDAEQVQGAGVVGVLFQDAAIDCLGLRQLSLLMELDGGGQSFGQGFHRDAGLPGCR